MKFLEKMQNPHYLATQEVSYLPILLTELIFVMIVLFFSIIGGLK